MATTQKKSELTELNLLGLFSLKTKVKEMTFAQLMVFVTIILAFLLAVIIVLRWYAVPTVGVPAILSQIPKLGIGRIFKARSP